MMTEILIDEVVVDVECDITLQFIERTIHEGRVVYVVRFKVGDDQPKETISHDRDLIKFYFENCKRVIG